MLTLLRLALAILLYIVAVHASVLYDNFDLALISLLLGLIAHPTTTTTTTKGKQL